VTTPYRITPPGWRSGRLTVAAIADLHAGGPNMTLEYIVRTVRSNQRARTDLRGAAGRLFRQPSLS